MICRREGVGWRRLLTAPAAVEDARGTWCRVEGVGARRRGRREGVLGRLWRARRRLRRAEGVARLADGGRRR